MVEQVSPVSQAGRPAAPFTKLLLQTFPASTTTAAAAAATPAAASFHTPPGLLAPDLHQGGLAPATDLHRRNIFDRNRSKLSLFAPTLDPATNSEPFLQLRNCGRSTCLDKEQRGQGSRSDHPLSLVKKMKLETMNLLFRLLFFS